LNIGDNFFNFSEYLFFDNLNNFFRNSFNSDFFDFDFDNFFNLLNNLNNFLNISSDMNNFLDYSINWDWNLNWNNNWSISFEEFRNFVDYWNNLINEDFFGYFVFLFNDFISFLFDDTDTLNNFFDFDNLFNDSFNDFRLGDICIDWNLNFFNSVLIEGHLNNLFDFDNLSIFDDSINTFLNDLRNFDDFLNDSRYDYNFFDNLLDLDNFWYFNHLLNNLFNVHSNLFNSFDGLGNFDDLLDKYFHWVVNIYVNNCWFLDFDDLRNFDNSVNELFNFNNSGNLASFDDNLSDDFGDSDNFLLNNWDLDSSFNNFFHFLNYFD